MNTSQWCILGVAASALAVYVLATMGLVRAGRTIDALKVQVEDLEDELDDFRAIRVRLLQDLYEARAKLKRHNPRDPKTGRFAG